MPGSPWRTRDPGPVGLGAVRLPVAERPFEEPPQLGERAVAFLDAEVDHPLPRLARGRNDDDSRTAAAAPVASCRLRGVERLHQPTRELALGRLERLAHHLPHTRRRDHVRLADPVVAARRAGGGNAVRPGPLGRGAVGREYPHLPEIHELVVGTEPIERGLGRQAVGEQLEPAPPVAPIGERLCRDGADTRAGPGHRRTGVERLRLHRHAQLPGRRVAGHDRVRHVATLVLVRGSQPSTSERTRAAYGASSTRSQPWKAPG